MNLFRVSSQVTNKQCLCERFVSGRLFLFGKKRLVYSPSISYAAEDITEAAELKMINAFEGCTAVILSYLH